MIYAVVSRQRRYFANSWNLAMTSGQSEGYPPLFYPALYDTAAHHANQSATSQLTDCDQQCKNHPCTDSDKQCLASNNVCYDYDKAACLTYTGFCWCGAEPEQTQPYAKSISAFHLDRPGPRGHALAISGISSGTHSYTITQGPTGLSGEVTDAWPRPPAGR